MASPLGLLLVPLSLELLRVVQGHVRRPFAAGEGPEGDGRAGCGTPRFAGSVGGGVLVPVLVIIVVVLVLVLVFVVVLGVFLPAGGRWAWWSRALLTAPLTCPLVTWAARASRITNSRAKTRPAARRLMPFTVTTAKKPETTPPAHALDPVGPEPAHEMKVNGIGARPKQDVQQGTPHHRAAAPGTTGAGSAAGPAGTAAAPPPTAARRPPSRSHSR